MRNWRIAALIMAVVFGCLPTIGQDVELPSQSRDLTALVAQLHAWTVEEPVALDMSMAGNTGTDEQANEVLDEAVSESADELRSVTDLIVIYQNLKCDEDRSLIKPLVQDRIRMYSRMLGTDAEKAVIPVNVAGVLAETTKRALQLHDELMAAKGKLDEVGATLQ